MKRKSSKPCYGTHTLVLFLLLAVIQPLSALQIQSGEYWYDADPGQGAGIPLSLASGMAINFEQLVPPDGLEPGFHFLGLRIQDELGRWSNQMQRSVYIVPPHEAQPEDLVLVAAEAWFDEDPGEGAGHPLAVASGAVVNLDSTLDLDTLDTGFHTWSLRVQDDSGRWSQIMSRSFTLVGPVGTPADTLHLAAAECFIDEDPGVGAAHSIPTPLDGSWDECLEAVQTRLEASGSGTHVVGLRFQDNLGRWSPTVLATSVTGIRLLTGTEFPELRWPGDLAGQLVHVYRSEGSGLPFVEIGVTADSFFVDPEGWLEESTRLYRITMDLAR